MAINHLDFLRHALAEQEKYLASATRDAARRHYERQIELLRRQIAEAES